MALGRLLTAASLAAALLTLTACGPDEAEGDAKRATPEPTVSVGLKPTADPSGEPSGEPTGEAPTASASDPAGDEGPSAPGDCADPSLPPGHKVLEVTAKPANGVIKAQATRYFCGMNGGSYNGAGAARAYRLAPGAGFELATDGARHRKASFAEVSQVIDKCVSSAGASYCRDNIFTVTTDASGRITAMSQVRHS